MLHTPLECLKALIPTVDTPVLDEFHVAKSIEIDHYGCYVYKRVTLGPIRVASDIVAANLPPAIAMAVYEQINKCFNAAVLNHDTTTLYVRSGNVGLGVFPMVIHAHITYGHRAGVKSVKAEWTMVTGDVACKHVLGLIDAELREHIAQSPNLYHWSDIINGGVAQYVI